jgi:hypothetical protein
MESALQGASLDAAVGQQATGSPSSAATARAASNV